MKELSTEEKAKAYDNIIEKANKMHSENCEACQMCIEELIPELAESEDEKIRKAIVKYVSALEWRKIYGVTRDDMLAWLEKQGKNNMGISEATKQELKDNLNKALEKETPESWNEFLDEQKPTNKVEPKFKVGDYVKNVNDKREPIYEIVYMDKECYICEYRGKENIGNKAVLHFAFDYPYLRLVQKPAEWSKEDEKHIDSLLERLKGLCRNEFKRTRFAINEDEDWLKSIKDRVQPKQEWSEKDEERRKKIIHILSLDGRIKNEELSDINDWLKSLRPQSQWKPSYEQMDALWSATEKYLESDDENVRKLRGEILESLYVDLKKLREE